VHPVHQLPAWVDPSLTASCSEGRWEFRTARRSRARRHPRTPAAPGGPATACRPEPGGAPRAVSSDSGSQ
jgi:hypothetical protein